MVRVLHASIFRPVFPLILQTSRLPHLEQRLITVKAGY